MATPNPGSQTTLNSIGTLEELTDLVRRDFQWTLNYFPRTALQLFIQDSVGAGNGSSKRYKEIDTETFADVKPEGVNSTKAKTGIGYEVDMTARTFSKECDVTLEMRNDNRYQQVGTMLRKLNEFCPNRQDLDLTHRLTFATSTSYVDMNGNTVDTTMGDNLALLNSAHLLSFSSTTYNNIVTGNPAFSQGSYESAKLIAATQVLTNFGERRTMNYNTIATGQDPATIRTVKQLLNSMADIDAAQSGVVNVYKDGTKHVVLPYLDSTASGAYDSTKRRWWFYMATGQGTDGWQAYVGNWITPQLRTPSAGNNGEDIHNLNWTFSTYCRFGIAVLSGRGAVGSSPTS